MSDHHGDTRARRLLDALRSELRRQNFAGRTVTLAEGAAVVSGTVGLLALGRRGADAGVIGGIGALGLADDLLEPRRRRAGRPVAKGLRGHLAALRSGHVTTGALKLAGIPALCLVGASAAPGPRRVLLDGALAAGGANLANLLDLRPGRALKVLLPALGVLAVLPAQADGPTERSASGRALAAAGLTTATLALPTDLRERGMLGDAGANVLGATAGAALARRAPVPMRLLALAVIVALTLLSERVSFSAVIDRTPALAALDRLGRLPGREGPR